MYLDPRRCVGLSTCIARFDDVERGSERYDARLFPIRHPGNVSVTWFHLTRLKVLAYVLGLLLAGLGLVSLTTMPVLPVLGVIVAAAAVVINKAAFRLSSPTCLGCGKDIGHLPDGEH